MRPACASHSRGGGLPARGCSVIVFDTNAAKGKLSSMASPKAVRAAIASNVPEPLMTGWASEMPQNSTLMLPCPPRAPTRAHAHESPENRDQPPPPPANLSRVLPHALQPLSGDHGAVDAHACVAVAGGHHAAEAGAEAARHARLQGELGGDRARFAQRPD